MWGEEGGEKKEMRRINPETGKNFKQGDVCEDGKIFIHYELVLDKDGYYKERKKKSTRILSSMHSLIWTPRGH